jgi:MOSC domain-containing protein
METELSSGSVVSLWRYPVKSMMGEEVNASDVTERGLLGDRRFALRDRETGKVVGAKNPRKWGNFFDFRAAFVESPQSGSTMPAVRITLPDGTIATSGEDDFERKLSRALGREVTFEEAQVRTEGAKAEEYWPDMEGLDFRDTVTDFDLPEGTFFDLAAVHLLTTATLDRLRELHPEGRLEARRFRPNIVVATGPQEQGFAENDWIGHTISIGDEVRLRVSGACPRCVMITLAQGDLPKDSEILRTAVQNNDANVGVYADIVKGGNVRRGDKVMVN